MYGNRVIRESATTPSEYSGRSFSTIFDVFRVDQSEITHAQQR